VGRKSGSKNEAGVLVKHGKLIQWKRGATLKGGRKDEGGSGAERKCQKFGWKGGQAVEKNASK